MTASVPELGPHGHLESVSEQSIAWHFRCETYRHVWTSGQQDETKGHPLTELHRDDVRVIPVFCQNCQRPVRLVEHIGQGTEMMTYVWPCPWCHQDNEGQFAGVVLAFKRFRRKLTE